MSIITRRHEGSQLKDKFMGFGFPFYPKIVPIEYYKEKLLNSIKRFQITIVQAETGSGKTIYVPKIFYLSKLFKKIIISQTKRVATIGAAKFLSSSMNEKLGDLIGYSVRFENKSGIDTKIKFVTDGILFQKLINNFIFEKNTCIILDEFHERTINTDLLICMLKQILILRKDLKLIFMSASGNSFKLAEYFNKNIGKLDIPGSIFKINTFYTKFPQKDFIISLCATISKLHLQEDINAGFLIFFPGYKEILDCEKMLNFILKKEYNNFSIFKLHSNLPLHEQMILINLIILRHRKVILATNIAESSLTIKGIKFVLDCGLSKQKILNWKTGLDLYKISPISKSEAKQRSGRAGRNSNGKCFRLFTYLEYSRFLNYPRPEIQRSELSSLFLHILTSNFSALFCLDFIDMPPSWLVKRSFENLFILGAINQKARLTRAGKILTIYPIDIKLSRCIMESLKMKNEKIKLYVLLSCSMLSLNHDFHKLNTQTAISNNCQNQNLHNTNEECYILATILKKFVNIKKNSNKRYWCNHQKFDFNILKLAFNISKQLIEINKISRNHFHLDQKDILNLQGTLDGFRYCFTSGFFQNSGRIFGETGNLQIISSGILVNINKFIKNKLKRRILILFHELIILQRISVRGLTSTNTSWLLYFGEKIFY